MLYAYVSVLYSLFLTSRVVPAEAKPDKADTEWNCKTHCGSTYFVYTWYSSELETQKHLFPCSKNTFMPIQGVGKRLHNKIHWDAESETGGTVPKPTSLLPSVHLASTCWIAAKRLEQASNIWVTAIQSFRPNKVEDYSKGSMAQTDHHACQKLGFSQCQPTKRIQYAEYILLCFWICSH